MAVGLSLRGSVCANHKYHQLDATCDHCFRNTPSSRINLSINWWGRVLSVGSLLVIGSSRLAAVHSERMVLVLSS